MANLVARVIRSIGRLPRRLLASAGWAQQEIPGLGAGGVHTRDVDEMEADRRKDRETWRQVEDQEPPNKP